MATQQPLALTNGPSTEAKGWRKGQEMIDALPYIDDYTTEEKSKADALIQEEMQRSTLRPSDYLKQLGPTPTPNFASHPLLMTEYERIKARQPMPGLDTTRYRLDPPSQARRNDVSAWKQALDNANSQLEHQYMRILNLELMLKYAPNVWRAHNQHTEVANKMLRTELESTRAEIDKLNKARKLQQVSAGNQLDKLHDEWIGLVRKNLEIDRACAMLEAEIGRLQSQLTAKQQAEEAKKKVEEEAKKRAEEEAKKRAEEERKRGEEEAKKQAEEERKQAEVQAAAVAAAQAAAAAVRAAGRARVEAEVEGEDRRASGGTGGTANGPTAQAESSANGNSDSNAAAGPPPPPPPPASSEQTEEAENSSAPGPPPPPPPATDAPQQNGVARSDTSEDGSTPTTTGDGASSQGADQSAVAPPPPPAPPA